MKEDEQLLAGIKDKVEQCMDQNVVTHTPFLDIRQRSLAESKCREYKGLRYCFYGGYEDAERTSGLFLPDYATLEEYNPLALLRITQVGYRELSHRDYLGSLTGLGIKREVIGDILVRRDGADVIILKEMSEFLLCHYEKAGRVNLEASIVPLESILIPEGRYEEKKDTVASLRLDNVIASAFSLSRGKAAEAINRGIISVNGLLCDKTDRQVKEGDKLVLRGKGKVLLKQVGGTTRKDRIFIIIDKYL